MRLWHIIALMVLVAGCNTPPPVGRPLLEGDGLPHEVYQELEEIDSLMWEKPDSALTLLMDYKGDLAGFNGHYAQLLAAELLFKNNYEQSNRMDLLLAVRYFDSLMDLHGEDARGASLPFLDARAHYINGVGYYERDSIAEACTEYLSTLKIMESLFGENELVGRKARFMAYTYNRLGDLFSAQFMQEPAIYCYKQALTYNRTAPTSPYGSSNNLYRIGKQFDKLKVADSAAYYYEMAMELLPDRNNMVYRDIVASRALSEIAFYGDAITALDSLKSMTAQAENETERLNRYRTIGSVYFSFEQYDSAKVYLMPVLEKDLNGAMLTAKYLKDISLKEGDTVKANEYALILANKGASAAESQAQVSKLNDIFQSYLQEKQEAASLRERRKAVRLTLMVLVPLLVAIGLAVAIVTRRSHKKRLAAQEAEAQRRLNEASQRLSEVSQRHEKELKQWQVETQKELDERERQHIETVKKQQEETIQQARAMLPQRVNDLYRSKVPNRMERIMAEFEVAYPLAMKRLSAAYPDLNEAERQIAVLNFLRFRSKEEADLTGFTENTTLKYRSNLNKKAGSDPISALLAEGKI